MHTVAVGAALALTASWISGAASDDPTGFGEWRGAEVRVAATWHDTGPDVQTEQWALTDDGSYGDWQWNLDNAIGAIFEGETWAQAAQGAYDERWSLTLQTMRDLREGDRGRMFIRFAHEFNGDWFDWAVHPGEEADFVTAWRRFAGLRDMYYPEAFLVWSPNDGTTTGIRTTRDAWPGRRYVDVVGVDSYNAWPHVPDVPFRVKINTRSGDEPVGIEAWREFAASNHRPMAVPEWSNPANPSDGGGGESPEYMTGFNHWLQRYGGRNQPGRVWYEALFNVAGYSPGNQYQLWPDTDQPVTAARYRDLWGGD